MTAQSLASDDADAIDALVQEIVESVVAPDAARVDAEGVFPASGLAALGRAGLLGLTSAREVGGLGADLGAAARVVETLARACGSTAMVTLMHYAAVTVIEAYGPEATRRAVAAGEHLCTLAFSETGSRSQFWVSASTASADPAGVRLDGQKSWVTAAGRAQSYVWSSRPLHGEGPLTLWLVPSDAPGLTQPGGFDGLGLRGNGSTPLTATGVRVDADAQLGPDGGGLDAALTLVLPSFLVLSAAFSLGLMEATTAETARHLTGTRLAHLDQTLLQQPLTRVDFARMRIDTDLVRTLVDDTVAALASGREDAMLRVLESKAAASEAAIRVTDLAMKVCGGAAFRKELGLERAFRDARAARVMAPTTDALLDFIGRALGGLPLLDG